METLEKHKKTMETDFQEEKLISFSFSASNMKLKLIKLEN